MSTSIQPMWWHIRSFCLVTSKMGSPEDSLVPTMFTVSSIRRERRRKRSQLQWRTPTPAFGRRLLAIISNWKHWRLFLTSSLMSSCSPNLCRRSKCGSLGKGGSTYIVLYNHSQYFGFSNLSLEFYLRLTWDITLPFQGRNVSPFSTAVLHQKHINFNLKIKIWQHSQSHGLFCGAHKEPQGGELV